jgi:hypothetical protein
MGWWNSVTGVGKKVYNTAKNAVGDVYAPVKKIINTAGAGVKWVDKTIDSLATMGVPLSLIDAIKDNPIWGAIHGANDIAQDLINTDLPRLGRAVDDAAQKIFGSATPGAALDTAIEQAPHIQRGVKPIVQKVPSLLVQHHSISPGIASGISQGIAVGA